MKKKRKSSLMRYINISTIPFLILSLSVIAGCSNTTKALINVKVQSQIDLNKYSNIAVLPFVQAEGGKEEWGETIAFILKRSITRSGKLNVMDLKDAKEMLGGKMSIDAFKDEANLREIGSILGVDGFISGSFKFQTVNEARSYYVERYSLRLQQYVYDEVPYFQRTYLLSIKFIMVDTSSGKIIMEENYNKRDSQAHSLGNLLISSSSENESILQSLVVSASNNFTNKLVPHYETEERVLVR